MHDHRIRSLLLGLFAALLVLPLATPAAAQTGGLGSDDEQIEEITVTARKREDTLQDVPFSVAAQTEQRLREAGADTLEQLANNVAAFSVQNLGPGQSQVAIRGISAGQIVRDQPGVKEQVGMYLDESVISLSLFTPDLDLFDLNRVEVLRGPQGTLFGSGSLAGTVRYITNQPNLEELTVTGEATGNAVQDGDFGGSLKSTVNVPIIEGVLALRATGYYTEYSGFIDALQPGFNVRDDVNDGERWGGRIALRWEPTDRLRITPRILYQEVNVDGFPRVDVFNILANPFTTTRPAVKLDEREQFTQFTETFEDEFLLIDATLEYDFGPVLLTSISSWTDRDILQVRDATALTASITAQPSILDQPESVYTLDGPLDDATEYQSFSQEIRLSSLGSGPLEWVIGGFYADIEREYGQSLDVRGFEDATGIGTAGVRAGKDILFFSDIPYDFEQLAFFGEATFAITEQLDFTAGVRWFDFEEDRSLTFDGIFADQTIDLPGDTDSDGWSPRFILAYDLNEDLQLNAQVAKGFRLGGINDPLNAPLCSAQDLATFGGAATFDDEEVWNYEVGAKTTFWDGRARVNGAVWYADIKDLQATLDAGTCSSRIVFNVEKARSIGVELEAVVQPIDDLDLGIAASYTDSELRSSVTSTDMGVTSVVGGVEDGNRLPTVPRFQLSAWATYTRPITAELEGFVSGNLQHVGSRWTQFSDQAPGFDTIDVQVTPIGMPSISTYSFDPKLDDYQIGNLRVGIRAESWEAAVFVNNIWDEQAHLALDRERGGRARVGYLTNQPRTLGVTTRVRF